MAMATAHEIAAVCYASPCRNEAANQILDCNDPAKVVLAIDDSR
jgi:hypothetical protein